MAKAWKIKHSFWWAVHQTCILDCTLLFFFSQNWEHLGGRCITYLNATRHISVCLNIPIYSKTVSALLEWIMDGKSRCWVISYDTIRFCLSQYDSLWDWCNLRWGDFQLASWWAILIWGIQVVHLIYRQHDSQWDVIKRGSQTWHQQRRGKKINKGCCQLFKWI